VAESNDAATAPERAFANAFGGAEDSLLGFITSGKLEFRGLADSILADLARMTVRQTITAPLAGALQSAFASGGLFGLFHDGGIVDERLPATRYADAAVSMHNTTTGAASPAPASSRTRSRSSRGAVSWWCRPSESCARRRRRVSSSRSPWW
jgi:lambda family phage tail tape measure protein